jgi:hypothetical protein
LRSCWEVSFGRYSFYLCVFFRVGNLESFGRLICQKNEAVVYRLTQESWKIDGMYPLISLKETAAESRQLMRQTHKFQNVTAQNIIFVKKVRGKFGSSNILNFLINEESTNPENGIRKAET